METVNRRFGEHSFLYISATRSYGVLFVACLLLIMVGAVSGHAAAAVQLQAFVSGLVNPLDLQSAKDGSGRLFAVEQRGAIRIIKAGKIMATPFLNVSGIIESGGEKGLLGLAFHPSYKTNRRFFVNYTRRVNGQLKTFIVEYRASISNPNVADVTTRKEILVVNQPFDNHNGDSSRLGPMATCT